MKNSLVDTLKSDTEFDWENSPLRSGLIATWTVVKWLGLGVLATMGFILWLIMSIVFAEVNERKS